MGSEGELISRYYSVNHIVSSIFMHSYYVNSKALHWNYEEEKSDEEEAEQSPWKRIDGGV